MAQSIAEVLSVARNPAIEAVRLPMTVPENNLKKAAGNSGSRMTEENSVGYSELRQPQNEQRQLAVPLLREERGGQALQQTLNQMTLQAVKFAAGPLDPLVTRPSSAVTTDQVFPS